MIFRWESSEFPNRAEGCMFRCGLPFEKTDEDYVLELGVTIFMWGFIPQRKLCMKFICEHADIRSTAV